MAEKVDYKEIGRNIRKYRQAAQLKQYELAELINVSPQHISHAESGVEISLSTLTAISNTLKIDMNSLLGTNLKLVKDTGVKETLHYIVNRLSDQDAEKLKCFCELFFET